MNLQCKLGVGWSYKYLAEKGEICGNVPRISPFNNFYEFDNKQEWVLIL